MPTFQSRGILLRPPPPRGGPRSHAHTASMVSARTSRERSDQGRGERMAAKQAIPRAEVKMGSLYTNAEYCPHFAGSYVGALSYRFKVPGRSWMPLLILAIEMGSFRKALCAGTGLWNV